MEKSLPTFQELLKFWLEKHGYSGIYDEDAGCGCPVDDLMLCGEYHDDVLLQCKPGYKISTDEGEGWVISDRKPKDPQ
jgi:hypothetical protein